MHPAVPAHGSDGWDLALASVRNLFAEADLHADEVGGDFAGEADRLGAAVSEVHDVLREQFGTEAVDATRSSEGMRRRLTAAVAAVPQLAEHADALEEVFARIGDAKGEAQRVHGDLHLGQTLRTSLGWKLVDFEGEPAKPAGRAPAPGLALARRRRDAALLRLRRPVGGQGPPRRRRPRARRSTYRATEWVERNRTAFLDGYVDAARARRRPSRPDGAGADRGLRGRQGRLRGALRGAQPAALAGHPARGHRTNRSIDDR